MTSEILLASGGLRQEPRPPAWLRSEDGHHCGNQFGQKSAVLSGRSHTVASGASQRGPQRSRGMDSVVDRLKILFVRLAGENTGVVLVEIEEHESE